MPDPLKVFDYTAESDDGRHQSVSLDVISLIWIHRIGPGIGSSAVEISKFFQTEGASYTGTREEFVASSRLRLTDAVVNPKDGAFYFTIGGRGQQSALYKVTYRPQETRRTKTTPMKRALSEHERQHLFKVGVIPGKIENRGSSR